MIQSIGVVSSILAIALFSSGVHAHTNVVVVPIGGDSGFTSCKLILDAGASYGDGSYLILVDREYTGVYCDMSTGTTYEAFAFGQYDSTYAGYTLPDITTWQNTAFQQAYIWHRNSSKGFLNLDVGFTSSNCCVALTSGKRLEFGAGGENYLYPYDTSGTRICSPASGHTDARYYVDIAFPSGLNVPYPIDFFISNPPVESNACSASSNPGIFVKSYQ